MKNQMMLGLVATMGGMVGGLIVGTVIAESHSKYDKAQFVATLPKPLIVGMPDGQDVSLSFDPTTHHYSVPNSDSVLPTMGKLAAVGANTVQIPTVIMQQNLTASAAASLYNQQIDAQFSAIVQQHQRIGVLGGACGLVLGVAGGFGIPLVVQRIRQQRQAAVRLA